MTTLRVDAAAEFVRLLREYDESWELWPSEQKLHRTIRAPADIGHWAIRNRALILKALEAPDEA